MRGAPSRTARALLLALLVVACRGAAPPPPRASTAAAPPAALPASRETTADDRGGPWTLDAVLSRAAEVSLTVARADEEAARARAERALERATWWPQLSVGASYWRNEGEVQSTEGTFLDVNKQNALLYASVAVRLDLEQALFGASAAGHRLAAAELSARAARADVTVEAARRFLALVEAEATLAIGEESVRHARELVDYE